MSMYKATFKNVSREVFNKVSDRVNSDSGLKIHVIIYYTGTSRDGDLTIEGQGGYGKEYKRVLTIFNEEYCK